MISKLPHDLHAGPVSLRLDKFVEVKPGGELVPYYHFKIVGPQKTIVGHINFRVGDTRHVTLCAGNIGYEILPEHRGYSYSYHACLALAPFVKAHYSRVVITVDPSNLSSIRIIEKLPARFIEQIDIPETDPAYVNGARVKRRYEWIL